ncbi:ATP-binding cassette domain-containing protein [Nocardiopsis ganjiahuensis]|uniref:ATP-binding cassette domain-containing protein n=1 Tax=Nocardiopsis ganjiahuensis TaxID=239984 RepID=UPI00126890D9|nr:ABC transporter ATP-binding protein [Nocardiopsis ganjiahuensis]
MTSDTVRFEGVVRHYDAQHVIGPLDLAVGPGHCAALVGPNGCGKSTMLRIAAGNEHPDDGTVEVLGVAPTQNSPAFRSRVFVLDEVSYFPDLTVREHLELVAVGHGHGDGTPERVDDALERCRLANHADLSPRKLSRGLQQLMSIASMLLAPRLELLVLDEPERHLDTEAKEWLAGFLADRKAEGACLLLATHHRPFVDALADQVHEFDALGNTFADTPEAAPADAPADAAGDDSAGSAGNTAGDTRRDDT